ncbi:MAG: M56 family metallopeptidase, partial [Cyclobacteriaceae bacterium]|nr:M56 family metallopeptidase [Cyclobacteriaceae bacterium]
MIALLNFILESSLCLFGFFILYFLLFRKDNQLNFRRFFILSSVVLSVLIPLLEVDLFNQSRIAPGIVSEQDPGIVFLPEITIQTDAGEEAGNQSFFQSRWLTITVGGFLLISTLMLLRFLRQVLFILKLRHDKRFEKTRREDYTLVYTRGLLPTFSFWNTVFISHDPVLSEQDHKQILDHELVHVRQYHSLDSVFFELVTSLLWYHPVIWYFKQEIKVVHEFLADRSATVQHDPEKYSSLLSRMALMSQGLSVGNYFNASQTLNRIHMLTLHDKVRQWWKTILYIPLTGILFFTFSCNKEIINELTVMQETLSQAEMPPAVAGHYQLLKASNPEQEFTYVEVSDDNIDTIDKLRNIDNKTFAAIYPFPERGVIGLLLSETDNFKMALAASNTNEVFTITEEPATPIGGYKEFYNYIATFLRYPAEARQLGVEGKVFVQFIVNKEGYLTDVQAVKGIGAGCDKEAVNIVSASPR